MKRMIIYYYQNLKCQCKKGKRDYHKLIINKEHNIINNNNNNNNNHNNFKEVLPHIFEKKIIFKNKYNF